MAKRPAKSPAPEADDPAPPIAAGPSNVPELSVSELANALKRTVEDRFGHVRVRGEITNYRGPHSSGHVYFSLKDQNARLDAVIWKMTFLRLRVKPQEGLEVVATGKITTFPGKSSYQIVIETLEPAGAGALMALLDERRKRLAAEGLFDAERKKPLPFLPRVVGVVTSPTGAVIRDILHRLLDRFPRRVLVWPVRVQGETCAAEVAAAIDGFNALPADGPIPRPDVLIVARGGGSLEDLFGFNEEIVVRAAAASAIPLVSAIGHETDTTLIDFVADLRAPTPTGAAEKCVPVRAELIEQTATLARRLAGAERRLLDADRRQLASLQRVLPAGAQLLLDAGPARRSRRRAAARQSAPRAGRPAPRALRVCPCARPPFAAGGAGARLRAAEGPAGAAAPGPRRARALWPGARPMARSGASTTPSSGCARPIIRIIDERQARLDRLDQLRRTLGYEQVLARGFALVRDETGALLRQAADVAPGQRLDVQFSDGHVAAQAESGGASPAPAPAARPKRGKDKGGGDQGSLF